MLSDLRLGLMKQIGAKKFFSRNFKKTILHFEEITHVFRQRFQMEEEI
jgi:hypothetical protein